MHWKIEVEEPGRGLTKAAHDLSTESEADDTTKRLLRSYETTLSNAETHSTETGEILPWSQFDWKSLAAHQR